MAERTALVEALEEIENGMCRIAETRDIWQNKLLYALCQGVRLLLEDKLKEKRTTRRKQGTWRIYYGDGVNAYGERITVAIAGKCSVCGRMRSVEKLQSECPNCGAIMEMEEQNGRTCKT